MKMNPYVKKLTPYSSTLIDTEVTLNANETKNYLFPDGYLMDVPFNEYPKNNKVLIGKLSMKYKLKNSNFLLGNGSTELLELIVKTYTSYEDKAFTFTPSFSMYDVYCQMHGVTLMKFPLDDEWKLNVNYFIKEQNIIQPKITFICNPNNPTGTLINKKDVIRIIKSTNNLVIVDEAYMEFAKEGYSVVDEINNYPNLIVARTFSKAYGLASIRLGYIIANQDIIKQVSKVKLPYSVNAMSLAVAKEALNKEELMLQFTKDITIQRTYLSKEIKALGYIVLPSEANFLFIKNEEQLQKKLLERNILIRSFNNNTYRITVGSALENRKLMQALKEVTYEKSNNK